MNFLSFLRDDLRAGLALTPEEYRTKHSHWLLAQQRSEGGFANRRGGADLYYTAFALRGVSALGALKPDVAVSAGAFLKSMLQVPAIERVRQPHGCFSDAVMAVSWWDSLFLCEEVAGPILSESERTAAIAETGARLDLLRRDDGGWGKGDADAAGSLYHSFLAACAYLRMDRAVPDAEKASDLLKVLSVPGGGFLENRFSKRPGTNGCAAALGLAMIVGHEFDAEKQISFLTDMVSPEGGFYATPAAPIADLLSTYTGLFSLKLLGVVDPMRVAKGLGYARTLETEGGYTGFALETVVDCEYTFYGLGVESIAHQVAAQLSQ